MTSTQSSSQITRAFMSFEMGKRIFLLLSAANSCSLAVITLATGQSPPVPPVTSEIDVTLSPSARRGFVLVRFHCARCHAIGKVGESPLASASAFRTLHLKYAVADLQRPLLQAEPMHPRFDLGADQVEDVMAYFKSLNGEASNGCAICLRERNTT
jgi:mono/diheme cytochrome c family protein